MASDYRLSPRRLGDRKAIRRGAHQSGGISGFRCGRRRERRNDDIPPSTHNVSRTCARGTKSSRRLPRASLVDSFKRPMRCGKHIDEAVGSSVANAALLGHMLPQRPPCCVADCYRVGISRYLFAFETLSRASRIVLFDFHPTSGWHWRSSRLDNRRGPSLPPGCA